MAIVVTPELLRTTSDAIVANMEHASAIANGYLANQENVMGAAWEGAAVTASHATATQIHADLQKVLTGGTRLAEGLTAAAALMESHEDDSVTALSGVFGGGAGGA